MPADPVSRTIWAWAHRVLPSYLLAHSVRSYCWGATLGDDEGIEFDRPILWAAALMHDVGLTRIGRNDTCFEFAGAARARRVLLRAGMPADHAERTARAIELHMAPGVTLDDGAEAVLLDRATGIDVRGAGIEAIGKVRDAITARLPRGDFDRRFLAAIRREVAIGPGCRSGELLERLEEPVASPWRGTP